MSRPFASPVPADYAAKVTAFATTAPGTTLAAAGWQQVLGDTMHYTLTVGPYMWLLGGAAEFEYATVWLMQTDWEAGDILHNTGGLPLAEAMALALQQATDYAWECFCNANQNAPSVGNTAADLKAWLDYIPYLPATVVAALQARCAK